MLVPPRPLLALTLISCLAAPAVAQKFIPKKIVFAGSAASQAELLSVSGLKPGTPLGQPEMQAAAQKLIDTGMFSDVRFAFDGLDLTYSLKPLAAAEPVHYANFPWWDERALNSAVAAKVPLFHGSVPPESAMQQEVAQALTGLLAEKGVQAIVTAVPAKDEKGRDAGIAFHIDSPPVQIASVDLSGASAPWVAQLTAVAKAEAGQDFDDATEATLSTAVRAIYHRKGYLDVSLTGFTHGQPQFADGKILVPVTATITEGGQYRLAGLHLSGDVLMSADEFARRAKIHPGDIADEDLLRETLAMVATPYKSHGYLHAKIDATPTLDSPHQTVDYAISVEPGPVFHMGQLSLVNLNDQQKAEVLRSWPLHPGDVYDATIVPQFLNRNKDRLHSLDGWSALWKACENEQTKAVDLVVSFQKGGL